MIVFLHRQLRFVDAFLGLGLVSKRKIQLLRWIEGTHDATAVASVASRSRCNVAKDFSDYSRLRLYPLLSGPTDHHEREGGGPELRRVRTVDGRRGGGGERRYLLQMRRVHPRRARPPPAAGCRPTTPSARSPAATASHAQTAAAAAGSTGTTTSTTRAIRGARPSTAWTARRAATGGARRPTTRRSTTGRRNTPVHSVQTALP